MRCLSLALMVLISLLSEFFGESMSSLWNDFWRLAPILIKGRLHGDSSSAEDLLLSKVDEKWVNDCLLFYS
jgi:hypothetical protein